MRWWKFAGWGLLALILLGSFPFFNFYEEGRKALSEDPTVWEEDIARLEAEATGPPGSVLFVGSSSIRLWSGIHEDMAPIPVIQRGFGGAKIDDVAHYADRLFAVDDPAAIVIFVGTNDMHPGSAKEPAVMLTSFMAIMKGLRELHPEVPVYYIAITPSFMRRDAWPAQQEVNGVITRYAEGDPLLQVIDTAPALMSAGELVRENYIFDGLHLSKQGYAVWTSVIRPRLLADLGFR